MATDAKQPYGDVTYADPGYQEDGQKRYPIDTAEHARAAWSYVNQQKNAGKYSPEDLKKVRDSIMAACKRLGVDISADESRSQVAEADIERYSPDQYRVPAGGTGGGEFGVNGSASSKKAVAHGKHGSHMTHSGHAAPRKKAAAGSTLAYDAKSGRGTGYGSANGDARVHRLQEALNRLGLKDGQGHQLKLDGKLGPKTTAAIEAAQKRLRLTPNGRVTPALLEKLASAKRLSDVKVTPVKKKVKAKRSLSDEIEEALMLTRAEPQFFNRSFKLDDIQIMRSGDGRTVEAYAAMFDAPYEVRDQHGHYMEVINRSAFNRTLSGGAGQKAMCLYNHGMTVHGTPSELGSVPLGTPLEIKPDGRGLLTVTRYNKGPFADQVLESIRNGDITAQSFRGRIVRSDPTGRLPRRRLGSPLPTVTRFELGLTDYGPTPTPVNSGAEIMAVRSLSDIIDDLAALDPDDREELLRALPKLPREATPDELDPDHDGDNDLVDPDEDLDEEDAEGLEPATPDHSGPGAEDSPQNPRHSGRLAMRRARLRAELTLRGISRGKAA